MMKMNKNKYFGFGLLIVGFILSTISTIVIISAAFSSQQSTSYIGLWLYIGAMVCVVSGIYLLYKVYKR